MKLINCMAVMMMLTSGALAANPSLPSYADPHMKVWNGRVYVSAGRDEYPEQPRCNIIQWDIFSTVDFVDWRHEVKIDPGDTFMGAGSKDCWASDIETRNGKYYFAFSNGSRETGMLVADQPNGPYIDVLGKPLIPASFSTNLEYDLTLFTDDDGTPYLIYGRDGKMPNGEMLRYQIARLNEDMISLAEEPRAILHDRPNGFNTDTRASDGSHIHKYRGRYYLSCHGSKYMSAEKVYGPYTNLRDVRLGGHPSFGEFHGQTYAMYEQGRLPYGNRRYRQCNVVYLHYRDNGDMIADPLFMQNGGPGGRPGKYYTMGVGNYDAAWPQIEAEWFFSKSPEVEKRDGPDEGFMLRELRNHSTVTFPLITWTRKDTPIKLRVQVLEPATIEIREKNAEGKLLGRVQVKPGASQGEWQTVTAKLKNNPGTRHLCFRFVADSEADDLLHLDWFSLK